MWWALEVDETLLARAPGTGFVVGSQIAGRYRIVRAIGTGGMGEVFEVEDLVVGTRVALKALRTDRSEPAMVERLRRELALARKVTHRNVCRIHDLGDHEGRVFLTMELLNGETLAERLQRGPLPEARAIFEQIAAGLGAAHAAGVIHRDFKSGNVMLAGDRAVVTDFGLARSEVVGEHRDLTDDGAIIGTAAYMAPEQVEGKPATTASDIYALGIVGFEMITGKVPFRAETPLATATLRLTTPAPTAGLPDPWRTVLAKCLARIPGERFATVEHVVAALGHKPPRTRTRAWLYSLAAVAMVALIVVAAIIVREPSPPSKQPSFTPITFRRGAVINARFAPDGRVVYAASWDGELPTTFVAQPGTPDVRALFAPGASLLAIAPDGKIALNLDTRLPNPFRSRRQGTLAVASLAGGEPARKTGNVSAADWAAGDHIPAIVRNVADTDSFEHGTMIYKAAGAESIEDVRLSRDGRQAALLVLRNGACTLLLVDAAGHSRVLANFFVVNGMAWSRDGRELWFTATRDAGSALALYAVDLDGRVREILRTPASMMLHDIAPDGRVLLSRDKYTREAALRTAPGVDRSLSWFDDTFPFSLSEDGTVLLFQEGGEAAPHGAAYVRRLDGSAPVKVWDGPAGTLSRDGKLVVVWGGGDANAERLMLLLVEGGEPRPIARGPIVIYHDLVFAPDGRLVFVGREAANGKAHLYVQAIPDGAPRMISPEPLTTSGNNFLSHDGRWLLAASPSRRFLLSTVDGATRDLIGLRADDELVGWSKDDRIYVARRTATTTAITLLDPNTGAREELFTIAPADAAGVEIPPQVALTFDAKTVVYSFRRRLSQLYLVEGLR